MKSSMSSEIWNEIVGYEDLYLVSSEGRVRSKSTGELQKTHLNNSGKYVALRLRRGNQTTKYRVHRLVAEAFLPNPENKPMVLHRDDVGTNNSLSNLYWGTRSDNAYDAIANGKHPHANKTHCKRGHEFTESNTKKTRDGRSCRACIEIREGGK